MTGFYMERNSRLKWVNGKFHFLCSVKCQKQPPEVFYKKRCSEKFRKIHRKTPKACNFIKKETLAQVISCEFYKNSKNTFLQNTSGRLLLKCAAIISGLKFKKRNFL